MSLDPDAYKAKAAYADRTFLAALAAAATLQTQSDNEYAAAAIICIAVIGRYLLRAQAVKAASQAVAFEIPVDLSETEGPEIAFEDSLDDLEKSDDAEA